MDDGLVELDLVDGETVDNASDLAHAIHMHFLAHDFRWRYGADLRTPHPDEIQHGLDRLIERLSVEPDGTGISSGRVYIHKENGAYDVYAHFGRIQQD